LRAFYPANQECYVYDSPEECFRLRLRDLACRQGEITGRNVLVVAPHRGGGGRRLR
jgi:hypothetical protein